MFSLPVETLIRKLNYSDSLCRELFPKHNNLGRKQKIAEVSAEAKFDGQSLQEAKIGGLLYILCSMKVSVSLNTHLL